MSALTRHLKICVSGGLLYGAGFSAWATIVYLTVGMAPFHQNGVTYAQTVLVYLAGGAAGGCLVGLAYPLRKSVLGALLLGAVALLPVYLGFTLLHRSSTLGLSGTLTVSAIAALVVGGSVSVGSWLDDHPQGMAPRWIDLLRFPTVPSILVVWVMALILGSIAWVIGIRYAGHWQAALAIPLFLVPAGFAIGVTVAGVRNRSQHGAG